MKFYQLVIPLLCLIFGSVLSSCKKKGCTNPIARNYSSTVEKDDGSCFFEKFPVIQYVAINETGTDTVVIYNGSPDRTWKLYDWQIGYSPDYQGAITYSTILPVQPEYELLPSTYARITSDFLGFEINSEMTIYLRDASTNLVDTWPQRIFD